MYVCRFDGPNEFIYFILLDFFFFINLCEETFLQSYNDPIFYFNVFLIFVK